MFNKDDFIRKKISYDIENNAIKKIHTRFPPEPNGYLHIGHAKSISLNFGVAYELKQENIDASCNLRFDDTNPEKEEVEYIESIKKDIKWLGWDWEDREYFASDYFQKFYEFAIFLIEKGLAYVDHSTAEEIREMRGTPIEVGKNSKYRNRSVEENLALFEEMKNGNATPGSCLLRAKIDMSDPNLVMRDPPIYRIRDVVHHRTGSEWRIYPMYDFAHCLSDAIERITHSLCTLEFEIHRPLYDWFIEAVEIPFPRPQQLEFARLNITYTVLSKRKMKLLVDNNIVDSWDDPRMPTISGLRRRGYTPNAIKSFCDEIGLTKTNSIQDISRLEEALRTELNEHSMRAMVVLDPVKLIIENYSDSTENFIAENNQMSSEHATHELSFSKELYIERSDVSEDPPKGYNRIAIGKEVRLKYAYYITCTRIEKDVQGNIIEVYATYDPKSRGGGTPDGRKVRGTIHWVSCAHSVDIEVHKFSSLFTEENPDKHGDEFLHYINPDSLCILKNAKAEEFLLELYNSYCRNQNAYPIQFLRNGYFIQDEIKSHQSDNPVFNLTVSLKDGWKKK